MQGTDDDKDFEWIAKDDSRVKMDAHTVFAFSMAAMARVSAHVIAATRSRRHSALLMSRKTSPTTACGHRLGPRIDKVPALRE